MSNYTYIIKQYNPDLTNIFKNAGSPSKVMCVGIDYAKTNHTAMICNGEGMILKNAFDIHNNPEGVDFLIERVKKICKKHSIKSKYVFFGGEDCGTFSTNFIETLRQRDWPVFRVDAGTAKKQRANFIASSDKVDLLGIVKTLLDKRCSFHASYSDVTLHLCSLTRHRSTLVDSKTRTGNRIHGIVDMLFPGFLDEKLSGIPSFSPASLWLMEDRFSSSQIKRKRRKTLIERLHGHGVKEAELKAAQLQSYASKVLLPPEEMTGVLQTALSHEARLYKAFLDSIAQTDKITALTLAKTPGAFLTTIKGTGIVLAAGVSSEIGPVEGQISLRRLSAYAGIVPRSKQSGGKNSPARHGTVSRRSNHRFKNFLVQCGNHMGQHGPAELKEDHGRRTANGQNADFGMARRYLRIGMHLMRTHSCYIPEEIRQSHDKDRRKEYYLRIWPKLRDKWRKSGALEEAFKPSNPLGEWKECIEAIYDIKLPLK